MDIPTNRLYGVSVIPVAIAASDNVTVRFWGDETAPQMFTNRMYSGSFDWNLPTDTSQAWYYRDLKKTKKLRVSITNDGAFPLNSFQINITTEPF